MSRLKAEQSIVHDQITRDRVTVERLETLLDQSRQECINAQASNQELQNEISRLKQKVSELQVKLYVLLSSLLFLHLAPLHFRAVAVRPSLRNFDSIRIKRRNIANRSPSSAGKSPTRGSTVPGRKKKVAGISS